MEHIRISKAHVHNLKNINLSIPKGKFIAITGISGSGKSSLAFDIIFEEGKNQYLRSIGILSGFDDDSRFEKIEGIGPTVAVHQNTVRQNNPRSTVGSKTGILNQLALIFSADGIMSNEYKERLTPGHFLYTTAEGMCVNCQGRGFLYDVNLEQLIPNRNMTLLEVYEKLKVTKGFLNILKKKYGSYFEIPFWEIDEDVREEIVYGTYDNGKQSYCIERIFKNALEKGEDVENLYERKICEECQGERVTDEAREVLLQGANIGRLGQMTLSNLKHFLEDIKEEELSQFSRNQLKNINEQLEQLINFRLGHLSLYREMSTLSGGELQRLFLYSHLESGLDSLIYVFDEPMAGLHPSEKQSIIDAIKRLRDIGNTVIVVEHDREVISQSDYVIEIGPKAGIDGGNVVYQGNAQDYKKADTLLSGYIYDKYTMLDYKTNEFKYNARDFISLEHANCNYLRDLSVNIPLNALVGVVGLSGSGKSSLIEDTLLKRLYTSKKYGTSKGLFGEEKISGFVKISQEPIGRNASSTPASYIGVWDKIRELFANEPLAIRMGMSPGHFSFHSKGACEKCGGSGYEKIFLTSNFSVNKICPECGGKRYNNDSLSVEYKGKTIKQVLEMSISEAIDFFSEHKNIVKPLATLEKMGMGYITLGQPTSSLSGGEAQRVKLAKELGKQNRGNILYVLDEPTTGLSMYDTELLIKLLEQLVKGGNSVIVIEHNIQVLNRCDYLIELGPEGGDKGGFITAKGTPKELKANSSSITGRYL